MRILLGVVGLIFLSSHSPTSDGLRFAITVANPTAAQGEAIGITLILTNEANYTIYALPLVHNQRQNKQCNTVRLFIESSDGRVFEKDLAEGYEVGQPYSLVEWVPLALPPSHRISRNFGMQFGEAGTVGTRTFFKHRYCERSNSQNCVSSLEPGRYKIWAQYFNSPDFVCVSYGDVEVRPMTIASDTITVTITR